MERILKKINHDLSEKLRKSSVTLDSEGMKKPSPELMSKVSGGLIMDLGDGYSGHCRYCGGQAYYWESDDPHDHQSYGIFCGTCGAVFSSYGNFDINNVN